MFRSEIIFCLLWNKKAAQLGGLFRLALTLRVKFLF